MCPGGITKIEADLGVLRKVPVSVTLVGEDTLLVFSVIVTDVVFAATAVLVGLSNIPVGEEDRLTTRPPVGALPVSVNVTETLLPPFTDEAPKVIFDNRAAWIVNGVVFAVPPAFA